MFYRFPAPIVLSLVLAAGWLSGCSSMGNASQRIAGIVTPYRIDIVQGNFVSSEQVAVLKAGMDRNTVRDVLGTPLLQSMFHSERWDYVFTFQRRGDEPQLRKVTVFFKDDRLERFEADTLPTEAEFVASLDSGRKSGKVPDLEASEEQLKRFQADPVKAAPVAAATTPSPAATRTPPRAYPPLESTAP